MNSQIGSGEKKMKSSSLKKPIRYSYLPIFDTKMAFKARQSTQTCIDTFAGRYIIHNIYLLIFPCTLISMYVLAPVSKHTTGEQLIK